VVDEQFLLAVGTAHSTAQVLGAKNALKNFRRALEKSYGTKGSGGSPIDQLRKRLQGIVPMNKV